MEERDKLARLRDEENRDKFAIRRAEGRMASEERQLDREMEEFEQAEEHAERQIDDELRREHWGHEPERPSVWPNHRERPQRRNP